MNKSILILAAAIIAAMIMYVSAPSDFDKCVAKFQPDKSKSQRGAAYVCAKAIK